MEEIKLKEGQSFGYGFNENCITENGFMTIKETIDAIKNNEESMDYDIVHIGISYAVDKKSIVEDAIVDIEDRLTESLYERHNVDNDARVKLGNGVEEKIVNLILEDVWFPFDEVIDWIADYDMIENDIVSLVKTEE